MGGVVGDEEVAGGIEADPVADAPFGEFHEDLPLPIRGDAADRPLLAIINSQDVPLRVASGAFDPFGEFAGLGERLGDPQRFGRIGDRGNACKGSGEDVGQGKPCCLTRELPEGWGAAHGRGSRLGCG